VLTYCGGRWGSGTRVHMSGEPLRRALRNGLPVSRYTNLQSDDTRFIQYLQLFNVLTNDFKLCEAIPVCSISQHDLYLFTTFGPPFPEASLSCPIHLPVSLNVRCTASCELPHIRDVEECFNWGYEVPSICRTDGEVLHTFRAI
jgi:hypothetical protein